MPGNGDARRLARTGSSGLRLAALGVAVLLVVALVALNLWDSTDQLANGFWIDLLACTIPLATAIACYLRSRTASIDRLAWSLIAIGLAFWALGAISRFLLLDDSSGRPVPAWVDPFFMAMYPFVLAGLILVLRNRLRAYRHLAIFDAVTGFLILTALTFTFFPDEVTALTGYDELGTVVLAFYPLGDIALIILTACLFRFTHEPRKGPWPLFGAGLTLFALADMVFAFTVPPRGATLSALYALWFLGFLLMIYGTWQGDGEVTEIEPGPIQVVPPLLFLVLAVAGLVYGQGHDLWDFAVILLTISLVLVLIRLAIYGNEYRKSVQASRILMVDQLTGLPSRTRLDELLERLSSARAWRDSPLYVLAIGIDRFGHIEEALGPAAMDTLISASATRIRRIAGEAGLLGVIERAEFGLVCSQESAPEPEALSARILDGFDRPIEIGGIEVQLGAVVGGARTPEDTDDPAELLRLALVSGAEARRHDERVRLSPSDPDRGRKGLKRLVELREALEEDQLVLYYQPKVRPSDGGVDSVEALVRWEHPTDGLLGPGEFVPLAEENGLMPRLTDVVADLAAAQKMAWRSQGIELDVAMNLGMADLIDESLPKRMEEALHRNGLGAGELTLEVSENLVMSKMAPLTANLRRLKEDGYRISLDDFGSGTTSLAHLRSLPLDEVKIDRSLISSMHQSPQDAAVGEAAVMIAKRLGLNVVAEGAEEASTVDRLTEIRCGEIQSFHYARPMDASSLPDWLDSQGA